MKKKLLILMATLIVSIFCLYGCGEEEKEIVSDQNVELEVQEDGTEESVENDVDDTVSNEEKEDESLAYVELKPLIESAHLDNIWGRNWLDWTVDDFISTFGLTTVDDHYFYNHEINYFAGKDERDVHPDYINSEIGFSDGRLHPYDSIEFCDDFKEYQRNYEDGFVTYLDDDLSNYLIENGLTTFEGFKQYFGIDDSTKMEVMTEYGKAGIYIQNEENVDFISISFPDETGNIVAVNFSYYKNQNGRMEWGYAVINI